MSAFVDAFKLLVQERLQAYDSTIDITSGSPADTLIVQPLLNRLGTDPFEIDIKSFLIQRGQEVFPDIDLITYDDLLINPISVFLEPLKQQINQIKLAQSISNISSINTEEVQDLMANWFTSPNEGTYSSGTARIYFPAPQSININTTDSIISTDNLIFNPTTNYTFTVPDMLFNRDGNLYYVDITVIASETGSKYNIGSNTLSYSDIVGNVGVKNLVKFVGGEDGQTSKQFVESVQTGLSERSLLTDRGIKANITDVKAITTIGAGDPAMMRDILKGGGEGLVYLIGIGAVFSSWVFLTTANYNLNKTINQDDLVRVQYTLKGAVETGKITNILWQGNNMAFVEVDTVFKGGNCTIILSKPGVITLDKTPDGDSVATLPDNTVHIYGHTDIFVRPLADEAVQLTIEKCSDTENTQFFTALKAFASNNLVQWDDVESYDISTGDVLVLETGGNADTYEIIQTSPDIRVNKLFASTETGIRGRLLKKLKINLNNPIVQKYPLKEVIKDLATSAGSFTVQTGVSLTNYGIVIGDVLEILDGRDIGKYKIVGFDSILQGRGPILEKSMVYTANGLAFRVYSLGTSIDLPLITLDEINLLDGDNQETGVNIPYARPVKVSNNCCTKQGVQNVVDIDTLMILPELSGVWPPSEVTATAASNTDARYSQRLEPHDGVIRTISADVGNPIILIEVNMPPFLWNGLNNKFIAYVSEKDMLATNDSSNNQQTSPLARAKKHDCLVVQKGPAKGSYLIKDVRILELWSKTAPGHQNIAVIEVYDEIQANPITSINGFITYVNNLGGAIAPLTSEDYFSIFDYSTDPNNINGFISLLSTKFQAALSYINFTMSGDDVKALVKNMLLSKYKVGPAPRVELRSYFTSPTEITYYSGNKGTFFGSGTILAKPVDLEATIVPETNVNPIYLPRDGSMPSANSRFFFSTTKSLVKSGVSIGDSLQFYPALNELLSRKSMQSSFVCITKAGSDIVRLVFPEKTTNTNFIYNKTDLQVGQMLFIDSGPDIGGYYVTEVIADTFPNHTVRIDKKLTHSTLNYPVGWSDSGMAQSTCLNNSKTITVNGAALLNAAAVDSYVSILSANSVSIINAGTDISFVGTYKITAVDINTSQITVDRSINFSSNASAYIIFHGIPATLPTNTVNGGKTLTTEYVRFHLYGAKPEYRTIDINWAVSPNPLDDSSTSQLKLSTPLANPNFNHKVPYRIFRKDIIRVKATEMSKNRDDNGLYYFDINAHLLSLDTELEEGTTFKLLDKFDSHGYTLKTRDTNYSYSIKEGVDLILVPTLRVAGRDDTSKTVLYGKNIKLKYTTSSKIQDIQNLVDSTSNRVLASNTLVRHYLPAQILLTIEYTGGSDTFIIANDIIDYINNLGSIEKTLKADQLLRILTKRGATYVRQPLLMQALVHGLNREIQLIKSNNILGTVTPVFDGHNSQLYWLPGKDLSTESTRPDGYGIKLIKN